MTVLLVSGKFTLSKIARRFVPAIFTAKAVHITRNATNDILPLYKNKNSKIIQIAKINIHFH